MVESETETVPIHALGCPVCEMLRSKLGTIEESFAFGVAIGETAAFSDPSDSGGALFRSLCAAHLPGYRKALVKVLVTFRDMAVRRGRGKG